MHSARFAEIGEGPSPHRGLLSLPYAPTDAGPPARMPMGGAYGPLFTPLHIARWREAELIEAVRQRGARRFGGEALAPGGPPEAVADVDLPDVNLA